MMSKGKKDKDKIGVLCMLILLVLPHNFPYYVATKQTLITLPLKERPFNLTDLRHHL